MRFVSAMFVGLAALACLGAVQATGTTLSENGRIAFARHGAGSDETFTYTANQDGSDVQRLFRGGPSGEPRWAPDGRRVVVLAACLDGAENCAFTIVDAVNGRVRQVKMRDPKLFTGCIVWSPDGKRFACEGFGEPDPRRNGIYTLRSSDGGGRVRVTANQSGYDEPGDYSPSGTRLVFARFGKDEKPLGLFVVRTDGGIARRITPRGTLHRSAGDWSPTGNSILFARRVSPESHTSLWTVRPDGSRLREIRLGGSTPCGGPIASPTTGGCIHPRWSPDGTKIIFTLFSKQGGREIENVYIVNKDGTGLTQVTREGNTDGTPDWGRAR
jgi:Tol biopolymer transport system component